MLDLYLLLKLGDRIGFVATVVLVVLTGILGAALARSEGTRVLRAWQRSLAAGTVPADGVVSGALVLLGGALLISPGVLTDVLGIVLLVPYTRRLVARLVSAAIKRGIERGSIRVVQSRAGSAEPFTGRPFRAPGAVIDVEGEPVVPDATAGGTSRDEHGRDKLDHGRR
jgi:UPF0716 protein FxsA